MREYGQVQCHFWQSPEALALSDQGKLLALYLLTGPHSNGLGCYRLPDGYVMADFGWSAETVSKGFKELLGAGFAERFEGVVFVPNFLKWNGISNPNVASARQKEFESLPKGEAKSRLAHAMLEFGKHWGDEFETLLQTLSKGLPKQNPTLPKPNQPEPTQVGGKPAPPDEFAEKFAHLKAIYPKRSGDHRWKTAEKHLRARLKEGHTWDEIFDGVRRYAEWVRHTGKERTETVKQAATFVGTDKPFLEDFDLPAQDEFEDPYIVNLQRARNARN